VEGGSRRARQESGPTRRRGRRWPRRLLVVALAIVALGVAFRLALDPLVEWRTRVALRDLDGYRGRCGDVRVSLRDLSYRIHDLRIEKLSAGGAALPFFEVAKAEIGVHWRELLRRHLVAGVRLESPKVNLIAAERKEERQVEDAPDAAGEAADELVPLRLDRIEIQDGEVLFVDRTSPEQPRLWLHDVEATVENFATRPALARGEPTVLALRGTLQRSGKVSIFATTDPLAKKLTFAGQARVTGLKLTELGELVVSKSGLTPTGGELDLSVRFAAEDGAISGGVRPVLKDPSVRAAKGGVGAKLKALVVDLSLDLFSDDIPGRDSVATTIPIEGSIDRPQVEALPTVMGIVRNAFVAGLTNSLANLPPGGGEAPPEQARRPPGPRRGASR
jgi:hypothetical protein